MNPSTGKFEQSTGIGVRISVGSDGRPWVVQANHTIWRGKTTSTTTGWDLLPGSGCANDIGAGADGAVYIIGCNAMGSELGIWLWDEQATASGNTPARNEWVPLDGAALKIAGAADGRPWAVQSSGLVFRRNTR